jgi:serine protease inhibitor
LVLAGCRSEPEFELPPPNLSRTPGQADLAQYSALNELGFGFFEGMDTGSDFVYSPLVVTRAFAVALNGSSSHLRDLLMSSLDVTEGSLDDYNKSQRALLNQLSAGEFRSAVGVFAVWPVLFDRFYVEKMGAQYGATVRKLGGATVEGRRLLDLWAQESAGLDSLGFQLSKDQQLLLAGVAAFDNSYKYASGSGPVLARYGEDKLATAVALELDSDVFELILLSPKLDLEILLHDLHDTRWSALTASMEERLVEVAAPPIRIDTGADLRDAVRSAALSLFDEECNLRGMAIELESGYSFSAVPHRARISINEGKALPPPYDPPKGVEVPQVRFDQPFVFALVEKKTGLIAMLGVEYPQD